MKEVEMEEGEREQKWCYCDGQVKADGDWMSKCRFVWHLTTGTMSVLLCSCGVGNISGQHKNRICIRSLACKQQTFL